MSKQHAVPSLSGWNTYAADHNGKHSYDFYTAAIREGGRQYTISPVQTQHGRHSAYMLSMFPGQNHGHTNIDCDGREVSYFAGADVRYRSPQAAVAAARKHDGQRARR